MNGANLLEALLWLTVACYTAASVLSILLLSFDRPALGRSAWYATTVGLGVHVAAVLYRWHLVGHGPYRTIQEILVCDSSFIVAAFLIVAWRSDKIRLLGAFVLPVALVAMGGGMMAPQASDYLSPSLRSPWLVVHVFFAKFTVGCIAVATGLAGGTLLEPTAIGRRFGLARLLPEQPKVGTLCHKLLQASFFFASLMIIAGAIWANDAWGRYWGWDPVETWSLITWTIYGLILHLRMHWRITDRLFAGLIVVAFVSSVVAYFLVPYGLTSIHAQYFS